MLNWSCRQTLMKIETVCSEWQSHFLRFSKYKNFHRSIWLMMKRTLYGYLSWNLSWDLFVIDYQSGMEFANFSCSINGYFVHSCFLQILKFRSKLTYGHFLQTNFLNKSAIAFIHYNRRFFTFPSAKKVPFIQLKEYHR